MEAEQQYGRCEIQLNHLPHNGDIKGESPESVPLSDSWLDCFKRTQG